MFVRSVRALDASGRPALVSAAVGVTLLAAWGAWFVLARVSVYEVSRSARLEVETAPHELDAPVAGRVTRNALALGRSVRAGELLLELDAERFRLEREAELTHLRTLAPQLEALGLEREAALRALRGEGQVAAAASEEERARQRAAAALARQAAAEQAQLERLAQQEAASALEASRTSAEAARHAAETEARAAALGRLGTEKGLRTAERRAHLARLAQSLARLEGERAVAEARVRLLDQEIALRQVRAPVAGRVESVSDLRPGTVVEAGARLAVIVPSGGLRAVAHHDPATSVGRVRPGQRARLRLHGFAWTRFGSIPAVVEQVGNEPGAEGVRVELRLLPDPGSRLPLQHGLPGTAEVEVERVSPASLALDAAGRYLTRSRSGP